MATMRAGFTSQGKEGIARGMCTFTDFFRRTRATGRPHWSDGWSALGDYSGATSLELRSARADRKTRAGSQRAQTTNRASLNPW
jgi:hypothetical protein